MAPGPHVLISVADTGCGMDTATRLRIFDPFFTTKPKGKGTGLGLSVAYGIIKQSGGNIWVYSELGRGSTFKVYFPRVDAPEDTGPVEVSTVELKGDELVLVAEDEESVRNLTRRVLEEAGFRVLAAANGAQALEIARTCGEPVKLLLTDVVMPGMSGKELASRLSSSNADMKVLYMSGYTDNAIVHHGVLDPGTHVLAKPFAATDLLRMVRLVLDGKDAKSQSPRSDPVPD